MDMYQNVFCNKIGHEGLQIYGICIKQGCQKQRACCRECILDHSTHKQSVIPIEKLIQEYNGQGQFIYLKPYKDLKNKLNLLMSQLEKKIQQFDYPIFPKDVGISYFNHFGEQLSQLNQNQNMETSMIKLGDQIQDQFIDFFESITQNKTQKNIIPKIQSGDDFLKIVCEDNMKYYQYFFQAFSGKLNYEYFNSQFNKNWQTHPNKIQRGQANNKYDYYPPKDCQGFGLNIEKYATENQDWIQKDGRAGEWRILYYATNKNDLQYILSDSIRPGRHQSHQAQVGIGIYLSDDISICSNYAQPNDYLKIYLMVRCKPSAIKQSKEMINKRLFVVNNNSDVRPYRILLQHC